MFRTFGMENALADWHSWRQVDTASVTREYVKHGIDLLHPRYHDVSDIPSEMLNLEGWRMVEFPILNALVAQLVLWNPDWPLVQTHRYVSILASLVSLVCLAELTRRWYGRGMSLAVATIFGFMPFNVYYSRVVLPEPFMVMWALVGALALAEWSRRTAQRLDQKQSLLISPADIFLLLSAASFGVALLVKPVAIFFAPLYFAVVWKDRRWSVVSVVKAAAVFGLSVVPLLWWRTWIEQFPSGIPASDWLFNQNKIRLKPAWWRWLFGDRVGRMMFGNWGAPFVFLGAVAAVWHWPSNKGKKQSWLVWAWDQVDTLVRTEGLVLLSAAGALAFLVIFATGNVQHDYYQTVILPALSLLAARGMTWVWRQAKTLWQQLWVGSGLLAISMLSFVFAWYHIAPFFSVNNPAIVPAGQAVQRLTPHDALIIAPYQGDTTLLFATERRGWPIGFDIDKKRASGAAYYLATAADDETKMLMEQYPVLEQTDLYILIDLRVPLATGSAQTPKTE